MNPNYSHLDPIAVVALVVIAILAVFSTKASSMFNKIATIVHLFVIAFIIIVGLINANPENYASFAPFGTRGVFKASAVLFFAYIGFDAVSTMAEETKNPGRDIPIGLVGSMVIITIIYCLLASTLCLMQNYKTIDINAPFSVAFSSIGWGWAKYIVAFGALKGMTTVLLVNVVAAMVIATSVVAFFTNLRILSNLLSISTLSIFVLVAIGILVRRYYSSGVTTKENQVKLIVFVVLIIGSSCGMSVYRAMSDGWIGWAITAPFWFIGTGGIFFMVPKAKKPKVWGVPLVPWLPSLSIAINIFLLGSIDKDSYIRFGIWTGILLILLFSYWTTCFL
ncbi:unnamed protein product [Vicia faba]|uniref:Amino acid permease n=1 Tax=Vicia faba TaxID=3906 RepID=A0AAV1B8Y7_VICFA|nr:unnamed protein product [Vicia faba]